MKVGYFMGAKAGVGTTTILLACARALVQAGERVCVIDADDDLPGEIRATLAHAALRSAAEAVAAAQQLHGEALAGYLSVPGQPFGGLHWPSDDVTPAEILTALASSYSVVLIDAGSRCRARMAAWWPEVTHWTCIAAPEPSTIRAAERLLQRWYRAFVPVEHVLVIITRWTALLRGVEPSLRTRLHCRALHTIAETPSPDALQRLAAQWMVLPAMPRGLVQPAQVYAERPSPNRATVTTVDSAALVRIQRQLLSCLHQRIDVVALADGARDAAAVRAQVEPLLLTILAEHSHDIPPAYDRRQLLMTLLDEAVGLGPLEELLRDPATTEVMVNGVGDIYTERRGRVTRSSHRFHDDAHLRRIIERIVAPTGRRVDERSPIVDTRLPDGSRVNIVLPPLALRGPTVTIRRFGTQDWTLARLVAQDCVCPRHAALLAQQVRARKNVVVIGGTGSGKTTLLNALSAEIPAHERIITIEDAAELRLQQAHVVRLEARPANVEGEGTVTIRDLVRTALRMRPDRIIVGECRGAEALDMLQAMHTGHDGSLTTLHANSAHDAVTRLATLVCFAGLDLPLAVIYEQIAGAVDLIVQMERGPDGRRLVAGVHAVGAVEQGRVVLRPLDGMEAQGSRCHMPS